ncbi:hypothetical protein Nmel_000545 [Mimus melanotis]
MASEYSGKTRYGDGSRPEHGSHTHTRTQAIHIYTQTYSKRKAKVSERALPVDTTENPGILPPKRELGIQLKAANIQAAVALALRFNVSQSIQITFTAMTVTRFPEVHSSVMLEFAPGPFNLLPSRMPLLRTTPTDLSSKDTEAISFSFFYYTLYASLGCSNLIHTPRDRHEAKAIPGATFPDQLWGLARLMVYL